MGEIEKDNPLLQLFKNYSKLFKNLQDQIDNLKKGLDDLREKCAKIQ